LLTANQSYLTTPYLRALANQYNKTIPQIIFRFALQIGMLALTGTTDLQHMRDDLHIDNFELAADEVQHIETINNN
jgi:diketogulonate reductase-like aldo/keto reductase